MCAGLAGANAEDGISVGSFSQSSRGLQRNLICSPILSPPIALNRRGFWKAVATKQIGPGPELKRPIKPISSHGGAEVPDFPTQYSLARGQLKGNQSGAE